ncbi:unnamed protein product [Closterium sp. NIES-65]|nr:unnamed protein product [Closterium sp. NIES-65]
MSSRPSLPSSYPPQPLSQLNPSPHFPLPLLSLMSPAPSPHFTPPCPHSHPSPSSHHSYPVFPPLSLVFSPPPISPPRLQPRHRHGTASCTFDEVREMWPFKSQCLSSSLRTSSSPPSSSGAEAWRVRVTGGKCIVQSTALTRIRAPGLHTSVILSLPCHPLLPLSSSHAYHPLPPTPPPPPVLLCLHRHPLSPCPPLPPLSPSLPPVLLSPPCPPLSPLYSSLPPVLLSPPCPPSPPPKSSSVPAVLLSPPPIPSPSSPLPWRRWCTPDEPQGAHPLLHIPSPLFHSPHNPLPRLPSPCSPPPHFPTPLFPSPLFPSHRFSSPRFPSSRIPSPRFTSPHFQSLLFPVPPFPVPPFPSLPSPLPSSPYPPSPFLCLLYPPCPPLSPLTSSPPPILLSLLYHPLSLLSSSLILCLPRSPLSSSPHLVLLPPCPPPPLDLPSPPCHPLSPLSSPLPPVLPATLHCTPSSPSHLPAPPCLLDPSIRLHSSVNLLYGFYLDSFNRTVAIGALQWIAMQGATQATNDEAAAEERRRIERLQRQRKERRARRMAEWLIELCIMEDDDFVNVFRISPKLLEYIAPVMALPMSHFVEKLGIPLDLCVLIPIKYFASAMTFIDLGLYFGLPKTIVHRIVEAFLVHFPRRFKKTWVRFPTAEEMEEMALAFKEASVAGVDGQRPTVVPPEWHEDLRMV